MGSFFERGLLFLCQFFDAGVETRLATSSSVLLDHVLFRGFVESLLSFLVPVLRGGKVGFLNSFERFFGSALDYTLDGTVPSGVGGGHSHVLLG